MPPSEVPTNREDILRDVTEQIDLRAKADYPRLRWWSGRRAWGALFASIEDELDNYLNTSIAKIQEREIDGIIQTIKARREKLPISTGITDRILGICQQLLAFGAAGLALTIGFIDKVRAFPIEVQKVLAVFGIFYLELVLLSYSCWFGISCRLTFAIHSYISVKQAMLGPGSTMRPYPRSRDAPSSSQRRGTWPPSRMPRTSFSSPTRF